MTIERTAASAAAKHEKYCTYPACPGCWTMLPPKPDRMRHEKVLKQAAEDVFLIASKVGTPIALQNAALRLAEMVLTPIYYDDKGNRYHDEDLTHRIYTSAGPPDGRGGYLSYTGCSVSECGWRPLRERPGA